MNNYNTVYNINTYNNLYLRTLYRQSNKDSNQNSLFYDIFINLNNVPTGKPSNLTFSNEKTKTISSDYCPIHGYCSNTSSSLNTVISSTKDAQTKKLLKLLNLI